MALTARECVCAEISHWEGLSTRRGLCEDEKSCLDTLRRVKLWMDEEAAHREEIEQEAQQAEEQEEENEHADTRALFESYRKKLKKEGRR